MSKNKEYINSFLIEEGFRPKYDNDGDVIFKHEGDTYFISFKDNDDNFASIKRLGNINIDEDELFEVYKILNMLNSKYIIGKCTLIDDNKILAIDVDHLGSIEWFKNNFDSYLTIIKQINKDFIEEYSSI